MSKPIYIFLCTSLIVFASISCYGQRSTANSLDNLFFLDMSVPDVPALKAIGSGTTNLLKPSDVKEFVAAFDAFNTNGSITLPKSFAIEFSPGKALSKDWSIDSYQKNPLKYFLYNSALSIATNEGNKQSNFGDHLSVGFRFSWAEEKGDILRDKAFITSTAVPLFGSIHSRRVQIEDNYKAKKGIPPAMPLTTKQKEDVLKEMESDEIGEMVKKYSQDNWNATRIDIALAWTGETIDSLAENLHASSFAFWTTLAFRLGSHGQFIVGPNFHWFKTGDVEGKKIETSIPTRFYIGSNNIKGFIEYELKIVKLQNDEDQNSGTFNSGFEFRVKNDFWITYSAGIKNFFDSDSKFVTNLKVNYALSH
ncbi:MAG TPA: hypothetical protein VL443_15750 [Cyclobacteriaceae bacterium]|jgi:hypothetical protein|nr:hypothetical protein [Cyclobacteriaceae bacterium]